MPDLISLLLILTVVLAIPSLVGYWIVKSFTNLQHRTLLVHQTSNQKSELTPLRLQAYERLILFCERININQMILRVNHQDMDAKALKNALILTTQKEFEHNLTQQIYISNQLWEMIALLKDQTIEMITQSFLQAERGPKDLFINSLLRADDHLNSSMVSKVKEAIKKEVALYFST